MTREDRVAVLARSQRLRGAVLDWEDVVRGIGNLITVHSWRQRFGLDPRGWTRWVAKGRELGMALRWQSHDHSEAPELVVSREDSAVLAAWVEALEEFYLCRVPPRHGRRHADRGLEGLQCSEAGAA